MAVPVYCPTKAQVVLVLKDPPASAGDMGLEFQLWAGKAPWRRARHPAAAFFFKKITACLFSAVCRLVGARAFSGCGGRSYSLAAVEAPHRAASLVQDEL